MKIGVVITMYDEFELVYESILNIKNSYPDSYIVITQSNDGSLHKLLSELPHKVNEFIILPNLGNIHNRYSLPSYAICRNIGVGCSALYKTGIEFDSIVIFTGDTLIIDPNSFSRRYHEMIDNKWIAMVSQAFGQNFHASTDNPENGIAGNRPQTHNTTDFACCFFMLEGKFAIETIAFSKIIITNMWTSEQCLGDEMLRIIDGKPFREMVGLLNYENPYTPYSYNDGIVYHAKTNGKPSR